MKDLHLSPALIRSWLLHYLRPVLARHVIIILVLILGVLIAAIWRVNQLLTQPIDQTYLNEQQTELVRTNFDTVTIKKLEQLKSRQENASLLPEDITRANPFRE